MTLTPSVAASFGLLFALSLAPRVPSGTLLASGEMPAQIERAEPLFASAPWRLSEDPIFSVGAVLGPEAELFGEVADVVRLSSGTVVVADRQAAELRFFGSDGEFLGTAGRRGDGPGEFARTLDLSSVMKAGRSPRSFACNDRGVLAFVGRPASFPTEREGPYRPTVPITLMRLDGGLVELGRFPGSERYRLVFPENVSDRPQSLGKPPGSLPAGVCTPPRESGSRR